MTVKEVISQIELVDGKVKSLSTNRIYEIDDFVEQISDKLKWTKRQKEELKSYFMDYIKAPSDSAVYVENFIDKYKIGFSDGVYTVNGNVIGVDELYRMMWQRERLLPTELIKVLEDVEKISPRIDLQMQLYEKIMKKYNRETQIKSKYLQTLDKIYPDIEWRKILYNILKPNTKPFMHIFYDDGVGGTGKSTLLEVLTRIVGQENVSNILLDQFSNRFVFANMVGKYLNIGDDNGRNDELANVGTLKSIITGNRVTIDRKFMSPIEVRIFAKQLYATNIFPYIDFTDGGIMRRLNIVPMNKVIPKDIKLPTIDDEEIGRILREVFSAGDLEVNNNEIAITSSPLYRFYSNSTNISYNSYKSFCEDNGFRCMNIINFENKVKFIREFKIRKEKNMSNLKEINIDKEDMPF